VRSLPRPWRRLEFPGPNGRDRDGGGGALAFGADIKWKWHPYTEKPRFIVFGGARWGGGSGRRMIHTGE
jgi:hypothetical protein